MKINSTSSHKSFVPISFDGTFYAMTDTHSRTLKVAGVLSEIEKRCPKDEKAFFLDCGDFTGENFPAESIADIYSVFQKNNPNVKSVFNIGNTEAAALLGARLMFANPTDVDFIINKMADSGIDFVSASYCQMLDELPKTGAFFPRENKNIKPYTILHDKVESKAQKILVTGVFTEGMVVAWNLDKEKEALEKYVVPSIEKENPDKVILLLHDMTREAKELIKYAKDDLGIKNLELVVGGHPHCLEDFSIGDTRVLYPPAQGKGAYGILNGKNGFTFKDLGTKAGTYDYSSLRHGDGVINNTSSAKPLSIEPAYHKIISNPRNSALQKTVVSKCPYDLERYYVAELSKPTTFGTFVANSLRDYAEADVGIILNQI